MTLRPFAAPTTDELRSLYETSRWRRARRAFLRLHPVCAWPSCGARSTVVDHVVPRSRARDAVELQRLTWDRANWQALCKPHHDEKTRAEQGWGEPKPEPDRRQAARLLRLSPLRPSAVVTRDYTRGVA